MLKDLATSAGSFACSRSSIVGPNRPGLATVIVTAGDGIIAFLVHCSWSCDALLLLALIYLVQKDVALF